MLILASSSKFRKELLQRLRLEFKCHSPDIDEDQLKAKDHDPQTLAEQLSVLKAREVLKSHPNDIIIGSDQVLSFNGQILGKPITEQRAKEQLGELSGKTHELVTSFTVMNGKRVETHTVKSIMRMKTLTESEIKNYIEHDSPLECCGSYKLEKLGIVLFDEIECTDHTAIIGLPLMKLVKTLNNFGIKAI